VSSPIEPPSWRALEIGPGGVPPEQIRPIGPGAPGERPAAPTPGSDPWQNWMLASEAVDPPRRGLSNPAIAKIAGGLLVLLLVLGLAVWTNASNPLRRASTQIGVADCLASTGQRIGAVVDCANSTADFQVVGRYADSSDASDCSATPSDVAVIVSGPIVLCLDYMAVVGDCIFAGSQATRVGKVDCASTSPGVYRVEEVLRNSIDPQDCPADTTRTLVHLHDSQVICLGRS
jgi:hypothetical protein